MRLVLAAGLALLLLAGCGGGGDDKLSDPDFRAQANKLCVAYSQKVNSLPDPGGYGDLAQYAATAHKALVVALDGLQGLASVGRRSSRTTRPGSRATTGPCSAWTRSSKQPRTRTTRRSSGSARPRTPRTFAPTASPRGSESPSARTTDLSIATLVSRLGR